MGPTFTSKAPSLASVTIIAEWDHVLAQQRCSTVKVHFLYEPKTSAAPRRREETEETRALAAYRPPLPCSGEPRRDFAPSTPSPPLPCPQIPRLQEPADSKSTQPLNWRTTLEPEKRFSGICHFGASKLKINFQPQGPRHDWRAQLLTQGPVMGLSRKRAKAGGSVLLL